MSRTCISLLTDFGLHDSYVGQMKGVIASINPDAVVVDLSHAIPPQQIERAALVLADAIDAFPAGTIHVVVVDPGVGSRRRAIAAEMGVHRFVCPDNGLLTLVRQRLGLARFVELDQPRWWRPTVSRTFHGRDIFAPVAAEWSRGRDVAELGSASSRDLVALDLPEPTLNLNAAGGFRELNGKVVAIDHFGNLITSIVRSCVPAQAIGLEVRISNTSMSGIDECYADKPAGELTALLGSSDRLEIAMVNGSAAVRLNAGVGEGVTVRWKVPPL